jgi:hypothetical protein
MPQIEASPDAMRELASNIGKSLRAITGYNNDLTGKLNALGVSFQDEGIEIIHDHLQTTRKKIEDVLPDFQNLMEKLVEIAGLYKDSQKAITGEEPREGLNWGGIALAVPAVVLGLSAGAQTTVNTPLINTSQEIATVQNTKPAAHNYKATLQKWRKEADGSMTYDTPEETGKNLDYRQGKVEGYKGTCGVVSSGNILAMAGIKATEAELVKYCSENFAAFNETICETGKIHEHNGGTNSEDRRLILAHYGVPSERVPQMIETTDTNGKTVKAPNIEGIARAVESGKGVIISVDVAQFWYDKTERGSHAVTVTSVTRDKNGAVAGFWVTDSGRRRPYEYYPKKIIGDSLIDIPMNVTTNIIR